MASQPFALVSSVSPENVAALVRLKIPRRNQNDVAFSYPDPSFHLPPYATKAFMPILALNQNSVEAQELHCYAQHVALGGHDHVTQGFLG